jgi:hypothetical protein
MIMENISVLMKTDNSKMAARKRFGHFKKEEQRAIRTPEVTEIKGLKQLTAAWHRFVKEGPANSGEDRIHAFAERICSGFDATPELVERLSLVIQDGKMFRDFGSAMGIFLGALINISNGDSFRIHSSQAYPISHIAYKSGKNVIVEGDVIRGVGEKMIAGNVTVNGNVNHIVGKNMSGGVIRIKGNCRNSIGLKMTEGRIIIEGNCRNRVGSTMKGGTVIAKGNAGTSFGSLMEGGKLICLGNVDKALGYNMQSGRIIVKGDAGADVGDGMVGGEIHVYGEIGSIGNVIGGRIFHKGKLIVDK